MISTIARIDEMIKTSKAILSTPAAVAIRFAANMKHLLNAVYIKRTRPFDPLDIAVSIIPSVGVDSFGKANVRFSQTKVTWGDLPKADAATAYPVNGAIRFTWHNNTGDGMARADDQAVLIAYCKNKGRFRFNIVGGRRDGCKGLLDTPEFHGDHVHTWLSFITADGNVVSDSVYTGSMQVS